ncbi:MAG: DNA repair protein RecO [Bacilli bacterium]
MEIIGVVTRLTPFKEKDAMINVVAENKTYSFLARGVLGISSKNMASIQPFTKSRLMLTKGKEGLNLQTGTVIESYSKAKEGLQCLTALSFIGELTNKTIENEEAVKIFPYLDMALRKIDEGFHPLTIVLLYFAAVLKATGYGLEVTKCVISSQRSDITAISYLDGGFVAGPCFDALRHQKRNERQLKILRQIFLAKPEDYDRVTFESGECLEIIKDLAIYIQDVAGVKLKSIFLLEKAA